MTDFPQGDPLKPRRPGFDEGADEHPGQAEVDQVASQDITGPGEAGKVVDAPTPAAQDQDEGPLGEGGQLRGPDAGGGGGF
jgi:hypothetical protein